MVSLTPLNGTEILQVYGSSELLTTAQIAALSSGGSTPGGTNGQVQYNNNGMFGGLTSSQLLALIVSAPVNAVRIVTVSGPVTMTPADNIVEIAQTTSVSVTVNLPISPTVGLIQTIKDGSQNASLYPITLVAPVGNIDGTSTKTFTSNGVAISYYWNGTNFRIV